MNKKSKRQPPTKQQNKNKKKKKGSFSTIVLVAIFFIGLSVLLYPTISDFWNVKRQTQAIMNYDSLILDMTPEDYSAHFQKADKYNKKLGSMDNPFITHGKIEDMYYDALNIDGSGMMGYITIEKIKVQLPIYHGTSDQVLNSAVGHVEGSSLPVGGKGTHSVLSAHRGLPSAKLFTNLDKLVEGDIFTVKILDQIFTYQVDQIAIVLPHEVSNLKIDKNEDYCTLLTCTPYGINTHRMMVRGRRIDNIEPPKVLNVVTEAFQVDPLIVTPAVAAPMLGALLIFLLVKSGKQNKKKKNKAKTQTDNENKKD